MWNHCLPWKSGSNTSETTADLRCLSSISRTDMGSVSDVCVVCLNYGCVIMLLNSFRVVLGKMSVLSLDICLGIICSEALCQDFLV